MVIKKEITNDVFAEFQLDDDKIRDNEARLAKQEDEEMNASSQFVNEDVFADFKLDEIVKQNEELEQQRKKNAAQQIGLKGNSRNISAHRLRRLFTEKSTKEEAETSAVVSSRQSLRLLHLRSKEKSNSGDGKKKNSDDSDKESLDLQIGRAHV